MESRAKCVSSFLVALEAVHKLYKLTFLDQSIHTAIFSVCYHVLTKCSLCRHDYHRLVTGLRVAPSVSIRTDERIDNFAKNGGPGEV